MAKKKSNYTNENSKDFLIKEYKEANPTIPLSDIIYSINNNISTPRFAISYTDKAYQNPAFFRLLKERHVNPEVARQKEIDKYPKIPYIEDKEIRLTKGRFNTGKISTNLLDSIYDSSKRVGIPFEEALGLAGRESTLGIGRGFKKGKSISPTELMSNWQQVQSIYAPNSEINKYKKILEKYKERIPLNQDEIDFAEQFFNKRQKELDSIRPIEENPIDNALKVFMEGNYNRNDPNHTRMVKEDGKTLMSEPGIQKWAKSRGILKNGGVIRKSNRLLTLKAPNYYDLGGDFQTALVGNNPFNFKNTFSGSNVANMLKGGLASGLGNTVGSFTGNAISGGLESGAGNIIGGIGSTIGGAISVANPILGGLVSAGSGIISGITNALFGSKINKETVNEIEASNKGLNTLVLDSSNNDSILNQWSSQDFGRNFNKSDIGRDGLFSNKAENKYKSLKKQQDIARNRALAAFEGAIDSADTQSDLNVFANYSAYGGPVNIFGSGAIDYELAKEDLYNKQLSAMSKYKMSSMPNSFGVPEPIMFAKGGKIHIKPENRGKFTEYCGGKVTSECIARGKKSKSAAVRKRATFAANARKFKHADGGSLIDDINNNPISTAVKFLDPTGITSWYDVYSAGKDMYNNPSLANAGALGLELFGAIPLVGKAGKVVKGATKLGTKLMTKSAVKEFGKDFVSKYGLDPTREIGATLIDQSIVRTPGLIKDSYDYRPNEKAKGGHLNSYKKPNMNYKEGYIYDVTDEEIKILKELGYEFEYV